jgi:hypothetical protein
MRPSVRRNFVAALAAAVCVVLLTPAESQAQWGCRSFGYGNAGFASGYSTVVARRAAFCGGWGWGGGWGWRGGWGCGPRWACQPRFCSPCYPGGWYGWPGCGFGGWYGSPWYGSTWYSGVESVYLATPVGGGATFFSGGIVPFPVPLAVPVVAPVPLAARQPLTVQQPLAARQPMTAARLRQAMAASRPASAVQRRRAADLVASGDRHLRGPGGEAGLLAAASAYRRATAVAGDDPDTHLRHAIALTALGRDREAALATSRAVALDGRLAERPADRMPGQPVPVAARGAALLREIAAAADADGPAVAALADRWSVRFGGPLALLADDTASR